MSEKWLRTCEREDAIASLKLYSEVISKIELDLAYWKWAIISLHSALQSTMAFHLGFGNDLLVMTQEDAEKWIKANDAGTPYPDAKMDSFLNLYKKIKKHEILGFKFSPNGQQTASVKKLNYFRNEFIHFMPKGWSIEVTGLPDMCVDCLVIIEKLSEGSISGRWKNKTQSKNFNRLLKSTIRKTKKIYS